MFDANALINADLVSVFVSLIVIFGMLAEKDRSKCSNTLIMTFFVNMICTAANAGTYVKYGPSVPDWCISAVWTIANSFGVLTLLYFTMYCYFFISEKTDINKWLYYVPMTLDIVVFVFMLIWGLSGKIISVNQGEVVKTAGMPMWVWAYLMIFIAYLPVIAITKVKQIGVRSVCLLGTFGLMPLGASVAYTILGGSDYSYVAGTGSLIIIYVLLHNRRIIETEKEQTQNLERSNQNLQNKNDELEDKQKHLVDSMLNQEAQLEEITALMDELSNNHEQLEERYNIINSMTSIYYAAFYIDIKEDTYLTLTSKKYIDKCVESMEGAQAAMYIACDELMEPEYRTEMREFLTLSTLSERMKEVKTLTQTFQGTTAGWCRAYLIVADRDSDGNPSHVFYAVRTINEEREKELAHIAEMQEVNDITSNAGIGMWKIILSSDAEPRMIANKKMAELLDINPIDMTEEEIYRSWYDNIVPEAEASVQASVAEMLDGKFSENTYEWNHPSKGVIYVRCGGTACTDKDGSIVLRGYHSEVTDIVLAEEANKKELEAAKKKAESASAAKTSFLFNMSHDIRTPMNAIMGYTDLLEKYYNEPEKCLDYTAKIKSSSNFLLSLINEVLEMARIESGKATLDETVCEPGTIISEIYNVYSELMAKKNIAFIKTGDIKTKAIYVDTVKVREIFLNIISNSYKYTPEGGSISISTSELPSEKEGYISMRTVVSDTGIGMSKEYLPHLFEEFTREGNVTQTKIQGTGLGMPIVKKLVELMGGTITVESELGKGTTFIVETTHRVAEDNAVEEHNSINSDITDFAGKRILLAEDNDLNAEIAIAILSEAGFLVDRAEDGIVCVDMLQKADCGYYDLILMDVQMPNMDGYKATRIIREMKDSCRSQIPVVAMTANAFEEDRQNAFAAGMNEHLAKPIVIAKLFEVLQKVLK